MKKTYIKPEMEVVDINMFQPLLAGSESMNLNDTPEVDDPNDILAPELDMGLPCYFFE